MRELVRMIEKAKRDDSGFTLVELLVVVAIIGVLVAIIVPVMGGQTEEAEKQADRANIRTINSAAAMYYADEGEKATSISDLDDYIGGDNGDEIEWQYLDSAPSFSDGHMYTPSDLE